MSMKWLLTFNIQIWCGLKERDSGHLHSIEEVYQICQDYCDKVGDCITVTPTRFVYKNGWEDGVVVGWIRYPRFPLPFGKMTKRALNLGETLLTNLSQYRVSVVTPWKTYMLSKK